MEQKEVNEIIKQCVQLMVKFNYEHYYFKWPIPPHHIENWLNKNMKTKEETNESN